MRNSRRAAAAVSLTLLIGVLWSAPAHGAVSINGFTLDDQPGDYLGDGLSQVFTPANSTFTVTGSTTFANFNVNKNDGLHYASANIQPPVGQLLAVGTYQTTRMATATTAGLDITNYDQGCNTSTGTLVVLEIGVNRQGTLLHFAASYEFHCESGVVAMFGELRFNSRIGFAAVQTLNNAVLFPDQVIGTTSDPIAATFTNGGTLTLHPGGVTFDGLDPGDFAVAGNTCSGTRLLVNATCEVDVTFTPSLLLLRTAILHLAVDTYRGEVTYVVQGSGEDKSTSTLTIIPSPIQVLPGETSVLSGKLTLSDGASAAGQIIHILETPPGGSQTEIGQATTDESGGYSFTTPTLDVKGTFTFEAAWDGDPEHDGSSATTAIYVADSRIVFDSNRAGTYDVYSMNPDGSNVTVLSPSVAADDVTARLSLDGRKVAFASARDGNFDIFTMNVDGSNVVQLTKTTTSFNAWPAWSREGTKIAFVSTRSDAYGDIWSMNADGTGLVQLTTYAGVDEFPSWSPDGTKIAFDSFRSGNYEVYTMNTDGSGTVALTNNAADDYEPRWSPDGGQIAFSSNRSGTYEVWTMTSSGANQMQLTTDPSDNIDPTWSPDSAQVAFDSDRNGTGTLELYTVNVDGTGTTLLSSTGGVNELPDWGSIPTGVPIPSAKAGVAPGAVSTAAGSVDLFDESAAGTIEHTSATAGVWGATESLGGTPISAPGVASTGPGQLEVFVRGTDNALWEDTFQSGGWSGWASLGGVLASAPTAVSSGSGILDVFVRGTDAKVWHKSYVNGVWSVWTSLGGVLPTGAAPAAASMAANHLEVFVRGTDNAVWWKSWDGSIWTGWASLGGVIANDPAASSSLTNGVTMLARGAVDDKLWYRTYTSPTWSGWKSVSGGPMRSGPAAAAFQGGGVTDAFALFPDGNIWETVYDGAVWSSWSIVPPGAAPRAPQGPHVFPRQTPRWRSGFSRRGTPNPLSWAFRG
jgi:Tol biopolymer transport system component